MRRRVEDLSLEERNALQEEIILRQWREIAALRRRCSILQRLVDKARRGLLDRHPVRPTASRARQRAEALFETAAE